MGTLELLLIAVGLSMDAFAVAVCHGLSMKRATWKKALAVGLYFGIFQAVMPLAGYLAGSRFSDMIVSFDHWAAFIVLAFIGMKMSVGSLKRQEASGTVNSAGQRPDMQQASLAPSKMLPLAFATSIDALAVGVSFAFLQVKIVPAIIFIGVTTLSLSMLGVKIGSVFGLKLKSKAEFAGGVMLILIGVKILLEHLGIMAL